MREKSPTKNGRFHQLAFHTRTLCFRKRAMTICRVSMPENKSAKLCATKHSAEMDFIGRAAARRSRSCRAPGGRFSPCGKKKCILPNNRVVYRIWVATHIMSQFFCMDWDLPLWRAAASARCRHRAPRFMKDGNLSIYNSHICKPICFRGLANVSEMITFALRSYT